MAVSSLTRMTVPLASDQSNPNQGLLMPKLKYRFRVVFENFGVSTPRTELTKQVIDFTRPSVTFDEIPIEIYNSRLYLTGKHTWEMLTVNLRDDASGAVARLVGEQLQKQLDFVEQASAAAGASPTGTSHARPSARTATSGAAGPQSDRRMCRSRRSRAFRTRSLHRAASRLPPCGARVPCSPPCRR